MSRKYEQVEVTERRCTELKCDVCGAVAWCPQHRDWEQDEGGASDIWVGGGADEPHADVCTKCVEAFIKLIKKDPALLRKLLKREAAP